MNWIVYNTETGTLISKHETEPTTYSSVNSIAQVDFIFMPMQPLYLLRYDGNNVIANTEENIEAFKPIETAPIDSVYLKSILENLENPSMGQIVFVEEFNSTYRYDGDTWSQCGDNSILREGLIKGSLYADEVKVG